MKKQKLRPPQQAERCWPEASFSNIKFSTFFPQAIGMNKNLCSVVVPVLNMNMELNAKESYRGIRLLLANQG